MLADMSRIQEIYISFAGPRSRRTLLPFEEALRRNARTHRMFRPGCAGVSWVTWGNFHTKGFKSERASEHTSDGNIIIFIPRFSFSGYFGEDSQGN